MRPIDESIDPALLLEFVDESEEGLQQVVPQFVALEKDPRNAELVRKIFRPIHSLKGNAAYFGLMKTKALAHELETVLDLMRNGRLLAAKPVIDVLLEGVDHLLDMLHRVRIREDEVGDEGRYRNVLGRVRACAESGPGDCIERAAKALGVIRALCQKLRSEGHPACGDAEEAALLLEGEFGGGAPAPRAVVEAPGAVLTIRSILDKPIVKTLAPGDADTVGACLRDLAAAYTGGDASNVIAQALDNYNTMMSTVGFDELLRELLLGALDEFMQTLGREENGGPAVERGGGGASADRESARVRVGERKTMRVAEDDIDGFLEYVGELITVREMFGHLQQQLASAKVASSMTEEFATTNRFFSDLSHKLQKSIMEIRKIPVKGSLQKLTRIVRDVALEKGKRIDLELSGEDVRIDKSLLETLESPLVHMVRNAADHGIESHEVRIRAGKPPSGRIDVSVIEGEDAIEVRVRDDGAGLNLDAIREKAVAMGIVSTQRQLSDTDAIDMIFRSGLSTAQAVTEVSGRGVGMDVVRQNVEKAGGKIRVESWPGQGTEFVIQIPKSVGTQIINGFMVRAGQEFLIVPIERVEEAFVPSAADFVEMVGKGICVQRRGTVLPYIDGASVMGLARSDCLGTGCAGTVVIAVRRQTGLLGFGVDEILGMRQVVVKQVDGIDYSRDLFSGAAVLGNGKLAMVLDMEKAFG